MMSDEMLKKMPHAMLQGANEMMKKPLNDADGCEYSL